MKSNYRRRDFLATSTAVAAGLGFGLGTSADRSHAAGARFKTKLHKALIVNKPTEDELKQLKDAGFEGVEAGIVPPEEAAACRKVAEKCGMRIHSVLRGWAEFNSDDPSKVDKTFAVTEDALRAAQAYGADAVLLVPCRIGGMKMPAPRGVRHRVRPEDRPPHARRRRRQRALRRLHQGPQPRHRHLPRGGQAAHSRRREMRRGHRAGERLEQPLGAARDLPELRRLLQQPLGEGLLRHRQPREVRPAGGVDPSPSAA